MTHMSGGDLGGAHEVAVTIQDINSLLQLPIPHQDHVADIGAGWREKGAGVRGEMAFYLAEKTTGLHLHRATKLLNKCGVFPGSSADKESACNAGDPGSIPELGRSSGEDPLGTPSSFHGLP